MIINLEDTKDEGHNCNFCTRRDYDDYIVFKGSEPCRTLSVNICGYCFNDLKQGIKEINS